MGEVYRATDANLKRQVAIKVLPQTVATDPERLARFQREAEVLAALNHPNIAHIHGLEKSGGTLALVMELVEGPTLANRIGQGTIALDDALPIAKQIAEALEAAHEQGIIHRDLKPANIKVRDDGTVKVLDFGLAKMLESEASASSLTMSPTISVHTTQAGIILGTAAYMSPEQARGRAVDKRTDVWAFGCLLFEMLTSRRAFDAGETMSDAIAAILSREPAWTALPAGTPGRLRALLRRCLEKDQKRRLRDIGEARVCIDDLLTGAPEEAGVSAPSDAVSLFRPALPWGLLGSALVALAAVLALWAPWQKAPPRTPLRLMSEIGADVSLTLGIGVAAGASAILSPDGTMLAFIGRKAAETPELYIRRLDQLQATALSGTSGAGSPFFAPDGHWIGFFADSKLKKVW